MRGLLERLFQLEAKRTTVRIEAAGGLTTFMTMSYIIFVQPAILSSAGMVILVVFGVFLIASLMALKARGAILWGILGTGLAGIPLGVVKSNWSLEKAKRFIGLLMFIRPCSFYGM